MPMDPVLAAAQCRQSDSAGEAVDQRSAIAAARGQRAEHKSSSRLRWICVVAVGGGDHVERQTHQLEPEIEHDRSPADQPIMPSVESTTRIEYSKIRRDGSDKIPPTGSASPPNHSAPGPQEARKIIDDELPLKVVSLPAGSSNSSTAGDGQRAIASIRDQPRRFLPAIGAELSSTMAPTASTSSGNTGSN